jgi:acyl-CoA synthetase (NDP forming)
MLYNVPDQKIYRKAHELTKTLELDRLFNPRSVAIIGASPDKDKGGGFVLYGLLEGGFKGKLYPVNPRQTEVMGLRAYPSVLDIPDEVDEAIIAVAARIVPRVMAECIQKGIKFAVVHSAGFSELGAEGKELESEMLRIARQGGARIVGPNCMGIYNSRAHLNTILSEAYLIGEPGPISFIAQSGNVSENFISMGYERGLRHSKVVSIGNQSDLTIEDFLEYFADDPDTKIIGCYIEGIKRGRDFLQLAKQISLRKPIIVWKGGKSEAGARIAASHTASLAGNRTVFEAVLKQSGVVSADNLEELVDLAMGFTCPVLPDGNRLGLIAEAGSGTVTGADIQEGLGLAMPILSTETQKELDDVLKDMTMPSLTRQNPVDLGWLTYDVSPRLHLESCRIVGREVDAMVLLCYSHLDEDFANQLTALRDKMAKPIILVPGLPAMEQEGMRLLARKGIPTYTILQRALKVLSAMVRYSNYRRQA